MTLKNKNSYYICYIIDIIEKDNMICYKLKVTKAIFYFFSQEVTKAILFLLQMH